MDAQVEQLKGYMDASTNTVAVTGSGISYLYGMSRLKQQTNRMDLTRKLSAGYVKKHPDEYYALMKDSFLDATFEKGPSPVHKQLAKLEEMGKLQGIVTQNMDCLHTLAGSKNVVEIMGSFMDNVCADCGYEVHDCQIWSHGEVPKCPKCGGYMMPANLLGNSSAGGASSQARMQKAQDMIAAAQLVIIIGTTGFRSDEYLAKLNRSTILVQINPGSTVFDQIVQLNIKMDAEKVFDEILSA